MEVNLPSRKRRAIKANMDALLERVEADRLADEPWEDDSSATELEPKRVDSAGALAS